VKRLHVHLSVTDLDASIRFYATFFGDAPTVRKDDYAKWMLDDPRVNFAISERGRTPGLDHLGIQVEDGEELGEVYVRIKAADRPTLEVGETTCCYARSEKSWVIDPDNVAWETFLTTGAATIYGDDAEDGWIETVSAAGDAAPCCTPRPA
jgi:catechol 2,3-dioxygenase-like lactoylglutathione lyase family enzyme